MKPAILPCLLWLSAATAPIADPTCVPQPLPPALDSVAPLGPASDAIEFSATPSLQHPSRAWIVRLTRRGVVSATIEVIRLRQRDDCNRYVVEQRWAAPLRQEDYVVVFDQVAPLGLPRADAFTSMDPFVGELIMDGTSLELRLRAPGWRVTRTLNHYEQGGEALSAIFHTIVARHIPADLRPTNDWRTP